MHGLLCRKSRKELERDGVNEPIDQAEPLRLVGEETITKYKRQQRHLEESCGSGWIVGE